MKEHTLDAGSELRFEIGAKNEKVLVELKSGYAEVFGTELVKGKPYKFHAGAKVAIYTCKGCVLNVKGKTDVRYVAKETPMKEYLNAHETLEKMRVVADNKNSVGPIVMVVGPKNVGKSTICRILTNYAVRLGRQPIFVDIDVGQGSISIPGTVGASLVDRPTALEEGLSQKALLVYHFGHKSPGDNGPLYKMIISKLAKETLDGLKANKKTKSSGVIINTCGWIKGSGYKHLLHVAQAFRAGYIFVIDQERLYNELSRDIPSFVKIVLLPKSEGVVERSSSERSEARDLRIREYFYGNRLKLYPHTFDVKWSDLNIYKIASPLTASCNPLGVKAKNHITKLVSVQPGPFLLNRILAVTFAEYLDQDVIQTNISGFLCVTNVDLERHNVTVLSPQPAPLPNTILLFSELQFKNSN